MDVVIYSASSTITEPDRRYRLLVALNRTDRPTYTKFHCPTCTMPLAELVNQEVRAITDTMDMDNLDNGMVGIRCDGRTGHGRCSKWYYFSLSEAKSNAHA